MYNAPEKLAIARFSSAFDKKFVLMSYSLTPSDINFHTVLMSKVNLANYLSQKAGPLEPFLS